MNPDDILNEPMSPSLWDKVDREKLDGFFESARTMAAATATAGTTFMSMSDALSRIKEMKGMKKSLIAPDGPVDPSEFMTTPRVSPPWASTTVQWLREHHPGYVRGVSRSASFVDQLETALRNMRFRNYTEDGDYITTADAWDAKLHKEMADWIADGHADRARTSSKKELKKLKKAASELGEVEVHSFGGKVEVLTIEGSEEQESSDHLADAVAGLKPPSQLSPERELDEAVNNALREGDQRYGSW